jgi:UDP-N-acetylmuramate dehydrogenase
VVKVRQAKLPDPSVVPNAGSFFKNPVISRQQLKRIEHHYDRVPFFEVDSHRVKVPAAWLIDQSGLKSLRVGGASVHQRHALVLVNQCQASGDDLLNLARQVVKQVNKRFAIELEPEVRLMGERGLVEL